MNMVESKGIATEVFIAFALNIVAGVFTFFLTQQIVYALIIIALIEAITIAILYLQLKRRPKLVGIVQSFPTFAKGPGLPQIIESVTTEFVFWGISAKSLLSNDEFRELMIKKSKGDCVFKFLLLKPTSPFVAMRALEEGDTAIGWKNEIEANVIRLKELKDEHHLNIEVRLYNRFPVFRTIFVNSNTMYFGWYSIGLPGIRSPLLIIQNGQGTLYHPLRLIFNEIWSSGEEPYAHVTAVKPSESRNTEQASS
jgi:hypothetical protein